MPWQQGCLSGDHCDFDEICDIYCGYILNKGTKQLEKCGGYFWSLARARLLAEAGRSSLYCLNNMREGQKRVPEILRCICTETKIEMLVVGENNSNMLQNLLKMMGKWFVTHFKGIGETLPPSCSVLCFAASIHDTYSQACRFPSQGAWWWVDAGCPACLSCPYTSAHCPNLVTACAEADLPISQWKQ